MPIISPARGRDVAERDDYFARAPRTASVNAFALAVMADQSFFAIASLLTRADPATRGAELTPETAAQLRMKVECALPLTELLAAQTK